jgi:hypothetical protein
MDFRSGPDRIDRRAVRLTRTPLGEKAESAHAGDLHVTLNLSMARAPCSARPCRVGRRQGLLRIARGWHSTSRFPWARRPARPVSCFLTGPSHDVGRGGPLEPVPGIGVVVQMVGQWARPCRFGRCCFLHHVAISLLESLKGGHFSSFVPRDRSFAAPNHPPRRAPSASAPDLAPSPRRCRPPWRPRCPS